MLKISWGVIDTDRQNSAAISRQVFPRFAIGRFCCNESRERWWMTGMIRTQMVSIIDQKMVAVVWDALYDTNP
jgi:hypothetical protein